MGTTVFAGLRRQLVVALGGAFIFSGVAAAAEFSADSITTYGGHVSKGKVYLKGNNMRHENTAAGQTAIVILRADKKVTWLLQPAQKTYMEMRATKMKGAYSPGWEKEVEKLAVRKSLGTEMMNGQLCDKAFYTYRDKTMGTMTLWVSKRLKFPVKMVGKSSRGSMTMEHKNIKETKLANSLFEVPAGYKKTEMPTMPGIRGMPGMPRKR
jgi:outer membrane lipoprotein-sorting protein